ncbi:MAG: hypothetical protein IT529_00285 [Burkholderiales bacterium]|nr:hypothetical protein [Burkholderiales bacterium]
MTWDNDPSAAPLLARGGEGERVQAWQCIGCGKIEAPRPCIGVCQDRKIELVHADRYDEVLGQLKRARQAAQAAITLVRRLARTTPREGEWEHSYRALQQQARDLLAEDARDTTETRALRGD